MHSMLLRCFLKLFPYPPVTAVMTIFLCLRATDVTPPWRSFNFWVDLRRRGHQNECECSRPCSEGWLLRVFQWRVWQGCLSQFLALSLVCPLFNWTSDKHVLMVRSAPFYSSWNAHTCSSSSARVCVSNVAWSALL